MIQLPDLIFAMPLLVLAASSILALILEIIFKKSQIIVFYFCILSILASIYYSFKHMDTDITIFADFLRVNNAAYGFGVLILVSLLFTILSSKSYIKKNDINFSEFYCILMFSGVGMMSMVYANDILIVFLGLELM
jgi:NADH:ubiquinone oxidoreductase subunit 2 (subunit N)